MTRMHCAALLAFLLAYASLTKGIRLNCELIEASDLASTGPNSTAGLIAETYVAGNGSSRPTVQLFDFTIVCLASGTDEGRYSSVSVVANYTCDGAAPEGCNGSLIVSQFDFDCDGTPPRWAVVSPDVRTDPPDSSLASTVTRTDCAFCLPPSASDPAAPYDNVTHCTPCNTNCTNLNLCTGLSDQDCCNFYQDGACVIECTNMTVAAPNNTCVVVDCGTLTAPDNGNIVLSGTTVGSTANYSCDRGFELMQSGDTLRVCQQDGQWSGTAFTCQRVTCNALDDPPNGAVVQPMEPIQYQDVAIYSCSEGFLLSGNRRRTCQDDETWTGSDPECVADDSFTADEGGLGAADIALIVAGIFVFLILAAIIVFIVVTAIYKLRNEN